MTNKNNYSSRASAKKVDVDRSRKRVHNRLLYLCVFWLPQKWQDTASDVIVALFFLGGYVGVWGKPIYNWYQAHYVHVSGQVLNNVTTVPNTNQASKFTIDTDFRDQANLENLDRFNIISPDPVTLSLQANSPGNVAFYKRVISSQFVADYKFIPLGPDRANVVLQYDSLFRLIVGENNFKAISMEINSNYPAVPAQWTKVSDIEKQTTQRYIGGAGFLVGTEVEVKITAVPNIQNNLHLVVDVTYTPVTNNLGGAKQSARFQYDLKTPIESSAVNGQLGIGMINATGIKVQLNQLQVKDF